MSLMDRLVDRHLKHLQEGPSKPRSPSLVDRLNQRILRYIRRKEGEAQLISVSASPEGLVFRELGEGEQPQERTWEWDAIETISALRGDLYSHEEIIVEIRGPLGARHFLESTEGFSEVGRALKGHLPSAKAFDLWYAEALSPEAASRPILIYTRAPAHTP